MEDFGLYNVDFSNEFNHVDIKTLANYEPIHLFSLKSCTEAPEYYKSLKTTPYLRGHPKTTWIYFYSFITTHYLRGHFLCTKCGQKLQNLDHIPASYCPLGFWMPP